MEIKDVYRGNVAPNDPHLIWVRGTEILLFGNEGWVPVSGGGSSSAEDHLSETSENLIQNKAVYNQYMTEEDLLDIPIIMDSIYGSKYFTLVALEKCIFRFGSDSEDSSVSYSLDGGQTWSEPSYNDETPEVAAGTKVLWKGGLQSGHGAYGMYAVFSATGKYSVEGNIMSLLYGDSFSDKKELSDDYEDIFMGLFYGEDKLIDASHLYLSATTLAPSCYKDMFNNCENLKTAPRLYATTLNTACYKDMFSGCSSLTECPKLQAITTADECYSGMFRGCTSITETPELPATILADSCYNSMFSGCTSLKKASEIPATTVGEWSCSYMFNGCSALTEVTKTLPAQTLAEACYYGMFYGCSSLKNAPELAAETLAERCCKQMFKDCTSLETAPVLPAKVLATDCYEEMFSGCSNLSYIECLATTNINESNTFMWVSGVAPKGTFVGMGGSWSTGISGIPEGWDTELDYSSSYFTMEFINGGNIQLRSGDYGETQTITVWYRVNGGEWFTWTSNPSATNISTRSFNTGDRVEFKYTGRIQNDYGRQRFGSPSGDLAKIKIYGNIMSLVDGDNFADSLVLSNTKSFAYLFRGWETVVDAENLVLPATTLYQNCYASMFDGCFNLAKAPKTLPATTLVSRCYDYMFEHTAITKSPEILGENYASQCMNWMFSYCPNLVEINLSILRNELDYISEFAYGVETKGTLTIPKESTVQNAQLQSAIPAGWTIKRI